MLSSYVSILINTVNVKMSLFVLLSQLNCWTKFFFYEFWHRVDGTLETVIISLVFALNFKEK